MSDDKERVDEIINDDAEDDEKQGEDTLDMEVGETNEDEYQDETREDVGAGEGINGEDDEGVGESMLEEQGDGDFVEETEIDFIPDDDDFLDESALASGTAKEKSPEEYKRDFTKNQLEAVLFVAGQALSAEEIAMKLGMSKKVTEELLDTLAMEYLDRSTSLEIAKIADKYILQLKPEFTSSVKSFASGGLIREAVMRTLTIIAAKQPILQSDLSKIRSAAGEHLKEMLEMGLVKAVPKGRSKELTTTDKFADMFGFSREVAKMKEQIKVYLTASTSKDDD